MNFRGTIRKIKQNLINHKLLALLLIFVFAFSGCGTDQKEGTTESEPTFSVYYITKDNDGIVEQSAEITATDTDGQIKELLTALSADAGSVDYHKAIPTDVTVQNYLLDYNTLTLVFSEEYSKMDPMTEVLCRAAVVETMTQIPVVMRVAFIIGEVPLTDSKGETVGFMTADSFVQNPGRQINAIQETYLTLYFSNMDGNGLVSEVQEVHYSSNISMEKLVIERLMEGPLGRGLKGTIPEGTQLLSVTTVDGVCYVNFDDAFRNQNYEIQEGVVIYSIVDSLLTLDWLEKVQISINGDTSGVYRDKYQLSTLYEWNEDIITGPSAARDMEEVEETEE